MTSVQRHVKSVGKKIVHVSGSESSLFYYFNLYINIVDSSVTTVITVQSF